MGIHDGHRDRIRESFLITGLEGKTEHQALELLLTYIIPRIDVNPIAHELINKFGSLAGVMDADVEDLVKVNYISFKGAVLLKLIPEISKMYHESKFQKRPQLNTYEKIKEYMVPKLSNEKNEVFYVLCFDNHLNLIRDIKHTEGTPESAPINIRFMVSEVLKTGATQLILVHNHLSSSTEPSDADINATISIIDAFEPLNIKVLDHLIISGNECFNLKSLAGLFPN